MASRRGGHVRDLHFKEDALLNGRLKQHRRRMGTHLAERGSS